METTFCFIFRSGLSTDSRCCECTPEIIKVLREATGLIAGEMAEEAARQIGVNVPTSHHWKEQHGITMTGT